MARILLEFDSTILGKPTELFIHIPKKLLKYQKKDIDSPRQEPLFSDKVLPPVVYLLHGKSGKGSSFYDFADLMRLSEEFGVITIAPNMDNSYYTNMAYGENYFDFLAYEVPQMIKETFSFPITKENTYVLGYSMGGYGAMKLGLTYPQRFSGIASLSGSLRSVDENRELIRTMDREDLRLCYGEEENARDEENDLYKLVKKAKKEGKKIPELFLYCGENDGLMTYNLRFREFLLEHHISHTFIKDEGSHDFKSWNKQIECYFKIINRKEEEND